MLNSTAPAVFKIGYWL